MKRKRKRLRYNLRTLLILMLVFCVVTASFKLLRDSMIANNRAWLLSHGGSNAALLNDGDIILLRYGDTCGAIVVKAQSMAPEKLEFDWYYRQDGDGRVFERVTAVSNGASIASIPTSMNNIHFGPFDLQWSGGDSGMGWFYYPDSSTVEFCIIPQQPLKDIDVMSEQWEFISAKDNEGSPVSPD